MANELNVKCNFTTVFAQFHTVEDLKAVANNICAQVKEAYEARVIEINNAKKGVVVEVAVEAAAAPAPQQKTKVSKTAAAKEAAARMKKQEAAVPQPKAKAASATETSDDTLIAITDTAAIKKLGLTFEKYNDRCWVLRGNTKPLRKVLKEKFRGVFNSRLTGGEGWVFKTASAQAVGDALGLKVKVA